MDTSQCISPEIIVELFCDIFGESLMQLLLLYGFNGPVEWSGQ